MNKKYYWAVFVILLAAQIATTIFEKSPPEKTRSFQDVDTFVPLGYQLIPIRISNQDEVSSLMGDFAIVDVYSSKGKTALLQAAKLIRSPNNPGVFAVLVQQNQARSLLSEDDNFYVALRNPKQLAAKSQSLRKRIIQEAP